MNRKKSDKNIYHLKELSDGMIQNNKTGNDNYIQKNYKKVDYKAFFTKRPKEINIENHVLKRETFFKKEKNNYDINKTPEKRRKSNINNDNNEKEEDIVTSFERKPSELKSPKTISESSFTSSFEKEKDKNENDEIIFIDKNKEEINNNSSSNHKEEENNEKTKEKNSNMEIKSKTTTTTKERKIINEKNDINKSNLKIIVNKTPREKIKNKEEKRPLFQVKQRKESENIEKKDLELKKEKICLTNVKTVKQKKYFIQTETQKKKYKKKYINVNFNKNNINKSNSNIDDKNKTFSKEDNKINNKFKGRNLLSQESSKKINNKKMNNPLKKNFFITNKTTSNKSNLKTEDSNSINSGNNKNITNLSKNISFHDNSKNIIYEPKKLISSITSRSAQKSEILAYKNTKFETNISNNKNIQNNNYFNNDIELLNKNKIIFDNILKNNCNFFADNNNININFNNYSQNIIKKRNSNNDLNNNNKLLTLNNNLNNLNNSKEDLNNLNNLYLQNLIQYNLNNSEINNNSLISPISINFEDLIILQNYFIEMILSLSKNKPIHNECFEFWNYYYNSSLLIQFEKIFSNKSDSNEVKISIYYSLMSIMLCYDYSLESNLFTKVIISLSDLLKLNYKNLLLICEYILKKISNDCITNIWVIKLASIVKESNFNDYTSQLLKGYNFTLVEKISYNTNIILQNLRYLLKNFKSQKNGLLTGIFKKIREKTYDEINIFFRENIIHVSNINGSILGSIFLLKNINFRQVPSPYVRTKNNKEYSLVLDLDETLIHFKPQNNGEEGGILRVRPGIYDFLDEIGKYYELIVFTTATQEYADVLIDAVEEDKIYFEHRLYREHATIIDNDFVKDLTRIGRPLDKIIIVDNMPQNFRLQKENGIIIKAFWGEDNSDRALYELIPILVKIAKEGGDVRKSLVKYKDEIVKKVTSCF